MNRDFKKQQKVAGGRRRREGRLWAATMFPHRLLAIALVESKRGVLG